MILCEWPSLSSLSASCLQTCSLIPFQLGFNWVTNTHSQSPLKINCHSWLPRKSVHKLNNDASSCFPAETWMMMTLKLRSCVQALVYKCLIFLRCALQSCNASLSVLPFSSIVLIDSRAAVISPIKMWLIASCSGERLIASVIFQARAFASSFLNVRICCSSLSAVTVYEGSLVFGLPVGQKKQLEVVTFGAG